MENYWILLTGSNVGKIIRRLWFDEIMDDLQARNWINKRQHGVRPGEFAEEALIIMIKLIRILNLVKITKGRKLKDYMFYSLISKKLLKKLRIKDCCSKLASRNLWHHL